MRVQAVQTSFRPSSLARPHPGFQESPSHPVTVDHFDPVSLIHSGSAGSCGHVPRGKPAVHPVFC